MTTANSQPGSGKLKGIRESLVTFWYERKASERKIISSLGSLVLLILIYLLLIAPPMSGRIQMDKSLPLLRQQSALLQDRAREASSLMNAAATPAAPVNRESIELSLTRKGLKPQNLSLNGDTIRLQLNGASFTGTLEWLDDMQKSARVSVVEANFVAQPALDTVNATLALRRPGGEQ